MAIISKQPSHVRSARYGMFEKLALLTCEYSGIERSPMKQRIESIADIVKDSWQQSSMKTNYQVQSRICRLTISSLAKVAQTLLRRRRHRRRHYQLHYFHHLYRIPGAKENQESRHKVKEAAIDLCTTGAFTNNFITCVGHAIMFSHPHRPPRPLTGRSTPRLPRRYIL